MIASRSRARPPTPDQHSASPRANPPGRRRPAGRRLLTARIALLLLGVLTPLLLLESALRVGGPFLPGDYQTAAFTAPSALIGRRNKPDSAGWKQTAEFTTWVRVNSQGLRGPDMAYAKPPGTFRIVLLGDSFTFALQVAEEQTFVARLAEQLNAGPGGPRVETLNAGTDAWSTANEYAWLVTEGHRYEPDLVIVMFYVGNDPGDNADQVGTPEQVDRRRLGVDRGGPLEAARDGLRGGSIAYNVFEQGVLAKLSPAPPDEDEPLDGQTLDAQQRRETAARLWGFDSERPIWGFDTNRKVRGWTVSEALLARLRDFCAARGIRLAVVEIPTAGQVTYAEPTTTPLPAIGRQVGLPVIELLDQFRTQPRRLRERLYFQQNRHWTEHGHALVARVLADELRVRGLAP